VIVDDEDSRCHGLLIGIARSAERVTMRRDDRDAYQAWLWGEVLLFGLLGAGLALFVVYPSLRDTYELPQLRLVLDTAVTLAAAIVAVLAGIRFSVEGRRLDFLLCAGFFVAAFSTFAFGIAPVFGGQTVHPAEEWAGIAGRLLAAGLIASAPFTRGRVVGRRRALRWATAALAAFVLSVWLSIRSLGEALPAIQQGDDQSLALIFALALQALLSLVALVGFGLRFRAEGDDLFRWLGLAASLALFAELHFVFTPVVSSSYVSQGDYLRLMSYGLLMTGVWRAIRFAEFGRAVAEERARVAREIHDGLAQYLFTVSTHASMLGAGSAPEGTIDRIKEAAAAAQQEARFAILALSSASGNAPFDAALRRYVEILTADGELEVELEIDPALSLAPDEQIEVFRIVQEGLANVRKHAGARRAEVVIGETSGRRVVRVRDDGAGFDGERDPAGQGLKNLRSRAASIGGAFSLRSAPGRGTALEITLRA
jgi:signal transduction histidine kinase